MWGICVPVEDPDQRQQRQTVHWRRRQCRLHRDAALAVARTFYDSASGCGPPCRPSAQGTNAEQTPNRDRRPKAVVITNLYATPDPRFPTGSVAPISARAVAATRPASPSSRDSCSFAPCLAKGQSHAFRGAIRIPERVGGDHHSSKHSHRSTAYRVTLG